jgi:hypothetical protein
VSHRWFERISACLHPREVVLERRGWGLRGQQGTRRVLQGEPDAQNPSWTLPLELLRSAMKEEGMQGRRMEIVLSGHFVRYALVPWAEQLVGRQERQAYLRHCFVTAYGETARDWDLRMCAPQPHENALGSGVEPALLEGLHQVLGEFDCVARAIHPTLMLAANRSRRKIPRGDCWLIAGEPDRVCLAHIARGVWRSVRQHALVPASHTPLFVQLENLLSRESVLCGDLEQAWPVVLYWPHPEVVPCFPGRHLIRVPTMTEDVILGDEGERQALWA